MTSTKKKNPNFIAWILNLKILLFPFANLQWTVGSDDPITRRFVLWEKTQRVYYWSFYCITVWYQRPFLVDMIVFA